MDWRAIEVKCEILRDPLPPGLAVDDLDHYLRSTTFKRRQKLLVPRRTFMIGLAPSVLSLQGSRQADAQGAIVLLNAAILGVQLAKDLWNLYQDISGKIRVSNSRRGDEDGDVLQIVRSAAVIENSSKLTIEIPAGATLVLDFDGICLTLALKILEFQKKFCGWERITIFTLRLILMVQRKKKAICWYTLTTGRASKIALCIVSPLEVDEGLREETLDLCQGQNL